MTWQLSHSRQPPGKAWTDSSAHPFKVWALRFFPENKA